jgi:hypothetical protein
MHHPHPRTSIALVGLACVLHGCHATETQDFRDPRCRDRAAHPTRARGSARECCNPRLPQPLRPMSAAFSPLALPTPNDWRSADGRPGPGYWQQRADYTIEARLDAEKHELHGKAKVTYTNASPQELEFLWIHLEQNIFRPDSLGTLASVPGTRFSNRADFEGGVRVAAVRTGDGTAPPLLGL